jgi:hypothetical protein
MCKEHIFTTLDRERDQIRLLYLDKSRHTVSSAATTLAGRLETVPLSEAPQYNALSYVWGSPTAVSSVCLDDGSSIPIGPNFSTHSRTWLSSTRYDSAYLGLSRTRLTKY